MKRDRGGTAVGEAFLSATGLVVPGGGKTLNVLGMPGSDPAHLSIFRLVHDDDLVVVRAGMAQAADGLASEGRARFMTLYGEPRWFDWRLEPAADEGVRLTLSPYAAPARPALGAWAAYGDGDAYARVLLDIAFDIVLVECDGAIVEMNEEGARRLGAPSPATFIGRPLTDIYTAEYRDLVLERVRRARQEWIPMPLVERRLLRCDGEPIEVEAAAIPVRRHGRAAVQAVFRDISERKRAEAALRSREHALEVITKVVPVGIFRAGVDGGIRFINTRLHEIAGRAEAAMLGRGWLEAVHPDERAAVAAAWERAVAQGRSFRREVRFLHPDGSVRWSLTQALPERDGAVLSGFVGSVTDITTTKQTEEELRRYRENLEGLVAERTRELVMVNRELESFGYSVSHDLRAPLRAINGFCSALWEDYGDTLPADAVHYLERIRGNTQRMGALIDDLLALARVSRHELRIQPVDLGELARSVLQELREADPGREVAVSIATDLVAQGDPTLLRMVMHNLLANAWKYTARSPAPRLRVGGYAQAGGGKVFYVRDNGVGFDMTQAGLLFEPFRRLHSHSEFEGNGVGLATVKRIVHRHGGEVWAESLPQQGSSFFFSLQPIHPWPSASGERRPET